MREKVVAPIILLVALLTTSIINIIYKVNHLESMIRLCIVFVIFYIVGKIAQRIIIKTIKNNEIVEEKILEDYMVSFEEGMASSEE